jgi:hypothetical protein
MTVMAPGIVHKSKETKATEKPQLPPPTQAEFVDFFFLRRIRV